jgi:hypothetical protein
MKLDELALTWAASSGVGVLDSVQRYQAPSGWYCTYILSIMTLISKPNLSFALAPVFLFIDRSRQTALYR